MILGNEIKAASEAGVRNRRGMSDWLAAAERLLVRLGPLRATVVLLLGGLAFGQAIHLVIAAVATPLFSRPMLICATVVTLVVTAPIVFQSQILIGRLVQSRRRLGDLTEHLAVALDHAQAANEAKSGFFTNASHELRTPLNAIIGFSELLTTQALGPIGQPRYAEYAQDIQRSAQLLLSLVNDILDLARSQSAEGKRDSDGMCDVRQTIEEATRMMGPAAERASVRLDRHVAEDVGGLRANERMLKQIVLNLLSNAVKFTAGGEVHLSAWRGADGGVRIAVADNGVGMTQAEIVVALTPFGQVANAIGHGEPGTGLGLPLAKAMMEMHDGTLTIDSEPGRGTVMTLNFSAARTISVAAPAPTPAAPAVLLSVARVAA
jgi:signal transduction histidine kinase